MGLLDKAIAINNAHTGSAPSHAVEACAVFQDVKTFIADFHRQNPQFHAIVLEGKGDIHSRLACHGAAVADLSGGNSLVLLPGALDRELFAHRISHSAGFLLISQMSADTPSLALETLSPWLQ